MDVNPSDKETRTPHSPAIVAKACGNTKCKCSVKLDAFATPPLLAPWKLSQNFFFFFLQSKMAGKNNLRADCKLLTLPRKHANNMDIHNTQNNNNNVHKI